MTVEMVSPAGTRVAVEGTTIEMLLSWGYVMASTEEEDTPKKSDSSKTPKASK